MTQMGQNTNKENKTITKQHKGNDVQLQSTKKWTDRK